MSNLSCCGRNFSNKFSLRRHIKSTHNLASPIFRCLVERCSKRFKSSIALKEHQKSHIYTSNIFYVKAQAFNNTTLVLRKDLLEEGVENFDFVTSVEAVDEVRKILNSEVIKKHALTFSIALTINFIKYGTDGEISAKASPCFLSSLNYVNTVSSFNVSELLQSCVLQIQQRYDDFVDKGSGWSIEGLKYYDLHITQTNDLRGGCSPLLMNNLENMVSRRSGLLSINNNDSKCLLYCIASAFTCKKNLSLIEKADPQQYTEFVNLIKVSDYKFTVDFPVSLIDITELERINRKGENNIPFRISVFREDLLSGKLFLIRSSPFTDGKIINVLLTEFTIDDNDYSHYVLIEKTSFFKKRYISSINSNISYANALFCKMCYEHFRSKTLLESHEEICGKRTHTKIFPNGEKTIHYSNHEFNFKRIFTGYADFESVLEETNVISECLKCDNSTNSEAQPTKCFHSFTIPVKKHQAVSVSFVVIDRYGKLVHEFLYSGKDVVVQFIKNVLKCEEVLVNTTKFNKYMIFTAEDKQCFEHATICHICKNRRKDKNTPEYPFTSVDPKVRDHDHLTGKFLGAAHKTCNLNKRREKPFLSIFMHNFSGYDSHLILPYLTKKLLPEVESVNVIPRSGEKFMSIKINRQITFLDSMNFLSGSLDSLNECIHQSCKYEIVKQSYLTCEKDKNNQSKLKFDSSKRMRYLLTKGSFPYEWAKSADDYSLPYLVPKSAFYNSITRSNISDEKYQLAEEMWKVFGMKNMRDYMETYCMCDTLILAEVFEAFRNESLKNFCMDPCHFISLPGFAYNAFLKQTDANLEYITDSDIFEMLSSNLRGGHSFCSQRYEESSIFQNLVNGEKTKSSSDVEEETQSMLMPFLTYFDANNL